MSSSMWYRWTLTASVRNWLNLILTFQAVVELFVFEITHGVNEFPV